MDLDELRSVQRTERERSQLQHLRDSFYRDVADYIEERKETYRREMAAADDPFAASDDLGRIKDEVETAADVVEALYERRVGKVVKQAAFAAAGMATEEEGMTAEERDLFDDLVARIRENRDCVLDTVAGEATPGGADGRTGDGGGDADAAPDRSPERSGAETPRPPADADDPGASPDADASTPPVDGAPPPVDDVLSEAMGGPAGEESAGERPGEVPASADAAGPGPEPEPGRGSAGVDAEADAGPGRGTDADGGTSSAPEAGTSAAPEVGTSAAPEAGGSAAGDGHEARPVPAGEAAPDAGGTDGASPTETDGASPTETDRVLVRVTSEVGEIFGVDGRSYDLAPEDVVTLPAPNAEPLVDGDAAERLD
jgi:DNA replication factor GINS